MEKQKLKGSQVESLLPLSLQSTVLAGASVGSPSPSLAQLSHVLQYPDSARKFLHLYGMPDNTGISGLGPSQSVFRQGPSGASSGLSF